MRGELGGAPFLGPTLPLVVSADLLPRSLSRKRGIFTVYYPRHWLTGQASGCL